MATFLGNLEAFRRLWRSPNSVAILTVYHTFFKHVTNWSKMVELFSFCPDRIVDESGSSTIWYSSRGQIFQRRQLLFPKVSPKFDDSLWKLLLDTPSQWKFNYICGCDVPLSLAKLCLMDSMYQFVYLTIVLKISSMNKWFQQSNAVRTFLSFPMTHEDELWHCELTYEYFSRTDFRPTWSFCLFTKSWLLDLVRIHLQFHHHLALFLNRFNVLPPHRENQCHSLPPNPSYCGVFLVDIFQQMHYFVKMTRIRRIVELPRHFSIKHIKHERNWKIWEKNTNKSI